MSQPAAIRSSDDQDEVTAPDVTAIMARIRQRVKEEVADHRDEQMPFKPMQADVEGKMSKKASDLVHSEELRFLNRNYNYSGRLNLDAVKSHRPGFIGRVIVAVKRKVLRIIWESLLKEYFQAEAQYQSNLVRFLNDMGQYVGARDASLFWELIRKIDVDVGKALERIERINDEQMASIRSSERRVFDALEDSLRDLRVQLSQVNASQAQHADQLKTFDGVVRGLEGIIARLSEPKAATTTEARATDATESKQIDYSYLLLENRYRGSESDIAGRLAIYPQIFKGSRLPVLEIGPGRGELQQLFRTAGIPSYGIDTDAAMVEASRAKGFDVRFENGLSHLEKCAPQSLGGVIAIQVVEHLTREQLAVLFRECHTKVASKGKIVFETINPRSMLALSSNYFRDPTHVFPQHPDSLGYAMTLAGLKVIETKFLSPVPQESLLRPIAIEEYMTPRWVAMIEAFNHNIKILNDLLFGHQDFCIVAEVP